MAKVRLRYSKTGKAKYISHLDLMATMRRALLRADVELKYSEGFNPHPYISVALPLQVGCGSLCELMDIGIAGDSSVPFSPESINAMLPEGIEVSEVYFPSEKFNAIEWISICGLLHYDRGAPKDAALRFAERFSAGSIVISKKTKRGVSDLDIAPYVRDVFVDGDNDISLSVKISAHNPSLSPDNIISALDNEYSDLVPDFAVFTRIDLYNSNMLIFR